MEREVSPGMSGGSSSALRTSGAMHHAESRRSNRSTWSSHRGKKTFRDHYIEFWRSYVVPWWPSLVGLFAVATAFTLHSWVAMLQFASGVVLLHQRAAERLSLIFRGQLWARILYLELGASAANTLLALALCVVRGRESGGLHSFDVVYVCVAIGGSCCSWSRWWAWATQDGYLQVRSYGYLPALPTLVLLTLILATATSFPVAMLPFLFLFLLLLARMQIKGLVPVGIPFRLVLVVWTSFYIASFFVLHFMGKRCPEALVQVFGSLAKQTMNPCADQVSWMRCRSHIGDFGLHLTCVLLLQFTLVNKRGCKDPDGGRELRYWASVFAFEVNTTTSDILTFRRWVLSALRAMECVVLINFALRMPGLHTFPLILKASNDSFNGTRMHFFRRCGHSSCFGCSCPRGGRESLRHEDPSETCSRGMVASMCDRFLLLYVCLLVVVDSVLRMDAFQTWGAWPFQPEGVDIVEWMFRHWIDRANNLNWLRPLKYEGNRTTVEVFNLAAISFLHMMRQQATRWDAGEDRLLLTLMHWLGTRMSRFCFILMQSSVPLVILLPLFRHILTWENGRASCWTALFSVNYALLLRVPQSGREQPVWPWICMHVLSCVGLIAVNAEEAFSGVSPDWMRLYFPAPQRTSSMLSCFASWPLLCIFLLSWFQHSSTRYQMSRCTHAGSKALTWASLLSAALAMVCRFLRIPVSWTPDELVYKLRRMREELDFFIVVILTFVTALLPPVDLHSMALLLSVGVAFLLYNRKVNRETTLPKILKLMHGMAVFFFCIRVVFSTQFAELAERGWGPFRADELGVGPMQDKVKLFMLVVISLYARKALVVMRASQGTPPSAGEVSVDFPSENGYDPDPGSHRTRKSILWEEQLLIFYAPSWAPKHAYEIASFLLIVVAFVVSITEVHLLNFIVIVTIIILTGFTHYWVEAGTAFAVTSVGAMTLQYLVRFHFFTQSWVDPWLLRCLGVRWTRAQVVRHCSILCLCLVQKQLWFRASFREKHRTPKCPKWLKSWASIIGVATLMTVAVARRHFWSVPLVLVTVPWVLHTDRQDTGTRKAEKALFTFRYALIVVLLAQVAARLGAEFEFIKADSPLFTSLCSIWGEAAQQECLKDWQRYANFDSGEEPCLCLLWEFFGLLILGLVHHLLHCDMESRMSYRRKQKGLARPEDSDPEEDQWAMQFHMNQGTRLWWPTVVMLFVFAMALQGGTLLGVSHLFIFLNMGSSMQAQLHVRIRWMQITKITAFVFLISGLVYQSPLGGCGRAPCDQSGSSVFVAHEECARLESLPPHLYATEENTQACGDSNTAMGHDNLSSLAMQVLGLRRVSGQAFSDGLLVLLDPRKQLGMLVALVVVTAIQLYMYQSPAYLNHGQEILSAESSEIWLHRARRYVVDFHCRCQWEGLAIKARRQMLKGKLHGTLEKISNILAGKESIKSKAHMAKKALIEEATLSQGFAKSTARMVLTEDEMFAQVPEVGSAYLEFLRHVTVGRESTRSLRDMKTSGRLFRQQEDWINKQNEQKRERINVKAKKRVKLSDRLGRTSGWTCWHRVVTMWRHFKRSNLLSELMFDYPFLGVDENLWNLRSMAEVQTDALSRHREDNGPLRIFWKVLLGCMPSVLALVAACCFLNSRSVVDLVRVSFVVFYVVRPYPFVSRLKLQFIMVYSIGVVVLRTLYDFSFICPGLSLRTLFVEEGRRRYAWCEVPTTVIGTDAIFGLSKRRGSGAIDPTSWMGAVGLDYLCIMAIYLHQWMLIRSGIWDFVEHDPTTQRVWLTFEAYARLQAEQEPELRTPADFEAQQGEGRVEQLDIIQTPPARKASVFKTSLPEGKLLDRLQLMCSKGEDDVDATDPEQGGNGRLSFHRGNALSARTLDVAQVVEGAEQTFQDLPSNEMRELRLIRFSHWHDLLVRSHVGLRRKFIHLYEMRAAERFKAKMEVKKEERSRDGGTMEFDQTRNLSTPVGRLASMDSTGNHHELLVRDDTATKSSLLVTGRSPYSGVMQGALNELNDWLLNLQNWLEELQAQVAGFAADPLHGVPLRERRNEGRHSDNLDIICEVGATFSHVQSFSSMNTPGTAAVNSLGSETGRHSSRAGSVGRQQRHLRATSGGEEHISGSHSPYRCVDDMESDGEIQVNMARGHFNTPSDSDLGVVMPADDGVSNSTRSRRPSQVGARNQFQDARSHIAAKRIQMAYLQWLQVRCDMGHRLKWSASPSPPRVWPYDAFGQGLGPFCCEVCDQRIDEEQSHWWCDLCPCFHACEGCVTRLKTEERMKTASRRRRERQRVQDATRPGLHLYGFQFVIGFVLLIYTVLFNHQLVEGDTSFAESFQTNSFTIFTIVLLVMHLLFLIVDRVFIRVHYYGRGNRSFNRWLLRSQTFIYAVAFITVHSAAIGRINPYKNSIRLWDDGFFCGYYILCMCYFAFAVMQRKLGLPAVDQDGIRTTRQPEVQGIFSEWVRNALFLVFYHIPFLDDIRIIIDWAVMPTSLDLWMYFKVEDAHTWLFRTRHLMFMRRQAFFAEARGFMEKLTFGWLFLACLFFLVIMPIILFSPITAQFTESPKVTEAAAGLSLVVASYCPDTGSAMFLDAAVCKVMQVPFYRSTIPIDGISELGDADPVDVGGSQFGLSSHVKWRIEIPSLSREFMLLSSSAGSLLGDMLRGPSPRVAVFSFEITMTFSNGDKMKVPTSVCYCAPTESCHSWESRWPLRLSDYCEGAATLLAEQSLLAFANWWHTGTDLTNQGPGEGWNQTSAHMVGIWHSGVVLDGAGLRPEWLPDIMNATLTVVGPSHCANQSFMDCPESSGFLANKTQGKLYLDCMLPRGHASFLASSFSVSVLYFSVVLVLGRYLRNTFQDSSKRAIYEEIPDSSFLLDLVVAINLARDHRELQTEMKLYYCLMKVLRSTHLLLVYGGMDLQGFGIGRKGDPPEEVKEGLDDAQATFRALFLPHSNEGSARRLTMPTGPQQRLRYPPPQLAVPTLMSPLPSGEPGLDGRDEPTPPVVGERESPAPSTAVGTATGSGSAAAAPSSQVRGGSDESLLDVRGFEIHAEPSSGNKQLVVL